MHRKDSPGVSSPPDPLSILLELRSQVAPDLTESLVTDVYTAEVEGIETEAPRAQVKATVRVRIEQATGLVP
jgi:hypothetical protein